MSSIVDTHCHIDLPEFDRDRETVIQSALDSEVHAAIVIGFNPLRWSTTLSLCSRFPHIVRAVGVHPNDASIWCDSVKHELQSECSANSVVAIGEIGLDFFRDRADRSLQRQAFHDQLALAREHELPVVIHQRNAESEMLDVLGAYAPVSGVMHCFTGGDSFAHRCIDLGLSLGIGGVATFPRSDELRHVIATVALDRIVVETDAPYLAPQRQRGRRNEPQFVVDVVDTIAAARNVNRAIVAAATTSNAVQLFGPLLLDALEQGRRAA